MKQNKTVRLFLTLLLVIPVCAGCMLLQNVAENIRHIEKKEIYYPEKRDLYSEWGKKKSVRKLLETEQLVIYEDRLFEINCMKQENTSYALEIAEGLKQKVPELENIYIMPIPGMGVLEEEYENERKEYEKFISKLEKSAKDGITILDPLASLEQHKNEYVYFATKSSWTMRGAFYGMQLIRSELGLRTNHLEGYRSYVFGEFDGELRSRAIEKYRNTEWETKIENIKKEPFYIYIKGTNPNLEELTFEDENGKIKTLKRTTVQLNARGNSSIIGNSYKHSIVEGEGEGSILVLNDARGKLLVPYLADIYEKIYVVNVYEDETFVPNLQNIIEKYDIRAAIWAQSAAEMGDSSYMKALNLLLEKGGE